MTLGKCLFTSERQTFLGDFPRKIWALRAPEVDTFRLLFVLSVTLKVIGVP